MGKYTNLVEEVLTEARVKKYKKIKLKNVGSGYWELKNVIVMVDGKPVSYTVDVENAKNYGGYGWTYSFTATKFTMAETNTMSGNDNTKAQVLNMINHIIEYGVDKNGTPTIGYDQRPK